MDYWVIVGEGGGYDEVKNIRPNADSQPRGEINKRTIYMDDITFTTGQRDGIKVFIRGEETTPPDVFMLWGHYNEVFEGISARLTSFGARSINDINAKRIVCSKLATALKLEEAGIPQAKTMTVTAGTLAKTVADTVGLPAVLKPSDGAQGEGVVLLHTEQEIADYIAKLSKGSTRAFLAQEYIAAAKGCDIRVTVIDYKVANVIKRVSDNSEEFRSNVHLGGHCEAFEIDEDTREMCERVAKTVGLRLCGIDLLDTGNGYIVGEVNCTPGMAPEFLASESFKRIMYSLITG